MNKALFLANTDWYLYHFRLSLARHLMSRGYDLVLVCPNGPHFSELQRLGFRCVSLDFPVGRASIFKELVLLLKIMRVYKKEKPSVAHHFTIRCLLYGSIAARLTGNIGVINAITGLGHLFTAPGIKAKIVRKFVCWLFARVLSWNQSYVVFQNSDDMTALLRMKAVRPDRCHLIFGSGVDCAVYSRNTGPGKKKKRSIQVLFASRLLREKGVFEYIEAAELLTNAKEPITFLLAGDIYKQNPSSLQPEDVLAIEATGVVKVLGHVDDMVSLLRHIDIVVLPSYREGCPRILIEAAAMGIPIVATDVPGCTAVVEHGVNGFVVPPRNKNALANAIRELSRNERLRAKYGRAGRIIAVERFDSALVLEKTSRIYESLLSKENCRLTAHRDSKLTSNCVSMTESQ